MSIRGGMNHPLHELLIRIPIPVLSVYRSPCCAFGDKFLGSNEFLFKVNMPIANTEG
jgi:hypothetical protein